MELTRNVGGRDRQARGVIAVLAGTVALWALWTGAGVLALVAGVTAVGLGVNAVTCFCGLNRALGIDTTED